MPLKPPFRIRRSPEALWIEDAAGMLRCYTYFDDDPKLRGIRQRWR